MMRRIPATRFPWIWACICFLLVLVIAALVVGLYSARRADHASQCINDNLAARAAPAQADAAAHIAFAEAVTELFLPKSATPEQRAAEAVRFKHAVRVYVNTLVADQAYRDRHPLGRC